MEMLFVVGTAKRCARVTLGYYVLYMSYNIHLTQNNVASGMRKRNNNKH